MNMIQYEFGVIPAIVKKESRADYIKSLEESQKEGSSQKFIDFMQNHHHRNILLQTEEYKASMESDGGQKNKGGQKRWSETTQKIFDLIKATPNISRKRLCDELNINSSAVQKHIKKLKEYKAIERIGGAKGGYWKVKRDR